MTGESPEVAAGAGRRPAPLDPAPLGFRRLAPADLPLLHRWLNNPAVARWFGAGPAYAAVEREYGPCIRGEEPTEPYLILYGGTPIGYIQTYRFADYPAAARALGILDAVDAVGVDLFIGEDANRGRGLGGALLRRFLREIVFGRDGAACCWIDPHPENAAAIRAYERAGFHYVRTVAADATGKPCWLMRVERAALAGA